ncbi:MAG: hypothetical protein DMG32_14600 [Acidobacteria bacterium]|nr:MAG: hypothetical protein DMG32_14600 [Acidobacteriota bacterium]
MFRFGIYTRDQYNRARAHNPQLRSGISYGLLEIGDNPTDEEVRAFEEVNATIQRSNGTFRKTFRQRFDNVDVATTRILKALYRADSELRVQDRAASDCLTSSQWAGRLFHDFPHTEFEASDALLYLLRLSLASGETYIVEPDGQPLQYIKPPFVVTLSHREAFRYPVNHLVAARARWRFRRLAVPQNWMQSYGGEGYRVDKLCCIHPEARSLSKRDPRFQICLRSAFDATTSVDVFRTMNILNRDYFSAEQLIQAAQAAFQSVKPGGIWIVGRTLESDLSNHVSFLKRHEKGWEVIERIGSGSEIEELACRATGGPEHNQKSLKSPQGSSSHRMYTTSTTL